jgi:hypothetical protein
MIPGYANCIRPPSGQQAGARWIAHSLLAIGSLKKHSLFGQAIQVGAHNVRCPVTTQFGTQVVYGDEKNIRTIGSLTD